MFTCRAFKFSAILKFRLSLMFLPPVVIIKRLRIASQTQGVDLQRNNANFQLLFEKFRDRKDKRLVDNNEIKLLTKNYKKLKKQA